VDGEIELVARNAEERKVRPGLLACGCPFGSAKNCPKLSCPGKRYYERLLRLPLRDGYDSTGGGW
jgi:hypothetical protein